jgi:cyclohexanone monooxygenase
MADRQVDAVVVGAGFAGLYMLYKLRALGLTAVAIEAGSDVGGTWYWNRYPGARCDLESMEYSYSFSPELEQYWEWSERYAPQPEILRYLQHVADRFDLRRDIVFDTRVTAAHWDEAAARWRIATDAGEALTARYCIMGTGCLSAPNRPDMPGLDSFTGDTFLTSRWPHEGVDFAGKRVAVIGTGSSGIQSIPEIAREADHLTVFQRTACFTVPAHNGPLAPEEAAKTKARYRELRAVQRASVGCVEDGIPPCADSALAMPEDAFQADLEARWAAGGLGAFVVTHADMMIDPRAGDRVAGFFHRKIRETVADPAVAAKLYPTRYPLGAKRLCVDSHYHATFNRDNVTLVDLAETPIERIVPEGIETSTGLHAVDAIVFATGFDAMTGALARIDIRGKGGLALTDKWAEGPRTYLGMMSAGFPNLFTITGPGSPSVISNMVCSIEQHVDWIGDLLADLERRGARTVEALPESEGPWGDHVNAVAAPTVFMQADSWYLGANIPGKPRVFMPYIGGVATYRAICDAVAADGYAGFAIDGVGTPAPGDFMAFLPELEPA